MSDSTKICTKCHRELPATTEYFIRERRGYDSLRSSCKECDKLYRQKFSEEKREYRRNYYKANREKLRKQQRVYYESNREKLKEWQQKYNKLNHDSVLANRTAYAKANIERRRVSAVRRRALKRNLPSAFTNAEWLNCLEYFHYTCAVCGNQLRDLFGNVEPHADHWIPLSSPDCLGTVAKNMICLCNHCNLGKSAKLPEQWLVEKYGAKKAKAILARILVYFESL